MKAAADVISRSVGEELVLLDLRRGVYFGLDEVGSRVWALMSEGNDAAAIAATLAAEYDAPADQIENDVRRLLEQLVEEGLAVE